LSKRDNPENLASVCRGFIISQDKRFHLAAREILSVYDSVILYWVKKYAHLLKNFKKKLKPKIKSRIHMDEVVLKGKGEKIYDINAVMERPVITSLVP